MPVEICPEPFIATYMFCTNYPNWPGLLKYFREIQFIVVWETEIGDLRLFLFINFY